MSEESWHHNWLGQQFSSFFQSIQTGSGAHPHLYSVRTVDSALEVKQPGNEAECLPLSSVEVKNGCSYTFTHTCLHVLCKGTALHLRSGDGRVFYAYIFLLKKAAHTVLGWNWDLSLSDQNAKLANYCNAKKYYEPVLEKLLVQVLSCDTVHRSQLKLCSWQSGTWLHIL